MAEFFTWWDVLGLWLFCAFTLAPFAVALVLMVERAIDAVRR